MNSAADRDAGGEEGRAAIVLFWIPVGAGGKFVARTSRWWELAQARLARRPAQELFHSALEITVDDARYVIEMAPAWGNPRDRDRGVVGTGPVGLVGLGRSRFFRYEVRCWRDGAIPDRQWAVDGPRILTRSAAIATTLLDRIWEVPLLTWGRTVEPTDDMWNSNSLISWLLVTSGIDTTSVAPPPTGRAPGWRAGLALARR